MREVPTKRPSSNPAARTSPRIPTIARPVPPWAGRSVPVHPLQRRLAIGPSDHPLERDADHVANAALAAKAGVHSGSIAVGSHRALADAGSTADAPASVHRALAQPGRPLDPAVRTDVESRFGRDFSHVRVHDGAAAAEAAGEIDAEAFTAGSHLVFAPARFAPATDCGRRLLAHELAHVVQQEGGGGDVIRRQTKGKKKQAKKKAPKAAKPVKKLSYINGEMAEGDPLTATELADVQTAGAKVPEQFRRYVGYKDVIRVGGSLAWRCNNPGNLRSSSLQLKQVKGGAGKFAAFKDLATGREAQKDLYLRIYGKMSVRDAINKLTPPSENDTAAYLKGLAAGGVDLDKEVEPQIDALMREVEKHEGLIPGVVLPRAHAKKPATPGGAWLGVPWAIPEDTASTGSPIDLPWEDRTEK